MASRPTHKINAEGKILGRLAVEVSNLLRGKDKTEFTPQHDIGDQVVVYNSSQIKVTGRKLENKRYYRHSGYIGNLKTTPLKDMNLGEAFRLAVRGMLPKNKLRDHWLKRLKIYDAEVPQRPKATQTKEDK